MSEHMTIYFPITSHVQLYSLLVSATTSLLRRGEAFTPGYIFRLARYLVAKKSGGSIGFSHLMYVEKYLQIIASFNLFGKQSGDNVLLTIGILLS